MKTIFIKTEDQFILNATLFEPEVSNKKLLVINSATGVKQQMYYSFAQYFAENGFLVITYDYRGIGLSKPTKLKGFKASMRTWGNTDFKAVTDYIQNKFPDFQKYCLGHSVGALILGMNSDAHIFQKYCFMATQNTYYGHLDFKTKFFAILGFGVAQPFLTKMLGYFPAHQFGLGESLPAGCSFDWRSLILHKKSINRLLEKTPDFSKNLTQEILFLGLEDDDWVTEKGMHALMEDTYTQMKPTYREVKVSESDAGKIGHINFFRSYNKNLWKMVLDWFS